MKKALICVALALVLTLPIAVGIARMPGIDEWFASGAGSEFFAPLFKVLDSVGGENDTDIIVATLLVVSFLVSLILAVALLAIDSHLRRPRHR
ncbi:hypothetical protein [Paraburkholderia sp. Cpub6]|uniref:hypothetical protein n=1 Tax=Paraburkholderia sp. Cpub6 TaxID=2723094 RepID=UPI00160E24FC|nr:hypothetical protein [Paraburkholderia sp. Cpub6]MBB5461426.1 hypothetical protein [Paraburkholderia sp. Cpub6]